MKRIWVIIGIVIVILLPVALLVYQNLDVIKKNVSLLKFSTRHTISQQYSVASKVPVYTPKIVDTSYLDYVIAYMKIFDNQAIADPEIYRGSRDSKTRYTVSRVQIELVPRIDQFLLAIGGENDFAGRGTYTVKDDTLIVQVSIDPNEILSGGVRGQYALEDVYLQTALQVLVYAVGSPDKRMDPKELAKIDKDLQEYLYTGIFNRPILIEKRGL